MTRKEKIIKLQKQGKTLKDIGAQFHISGERVRQILDSKFCDVHKINYFGTCKYCKVEKEYAKSLSKLTKDSLSKELVKLSKKGRQSVPSLMRKMLIKKMVDDYSLSFSDIGRKIKRDRTTVSSYYYQK
jgi:hypothetical protein